MAFAITPDEASGVASCVSQAMARSAQPSIGNSPILIDEDLELKVRATSPFMHPSCGASLHAGEKMCTITIWR